METNQCFLSGDVNFCKFLETINLCLNVRSHIYACTSLCVHLRLSSCIYKYILCICLCVYLDINVFAYLCVRLCVPCVSVFLLVWMLGWMDALVGVHWCICLTWYAQETFFPHMWMQVSTLTHWYPNYKNRGNPSKPLK